MDIGTLRGLGTVVITVALTGLMIWTYSSKCKESFDRVTVLSFVDGPEAKKYAEQASGSSKE